MFGFWMFLWWLFWDFAPPRVLPTEDEFRRIGWAVNATIWGDGCLCVNIPLFVVAAWLAGLIAGCVVYPWGMSVITAGFLLPVLNFLRPARASWLEKAGFFVADFLTLRMMYVLVVCVSHPGEIASVATDETLAWFFQRVSFVGYLTVSFTVGVVLGSAWSVFYLIGSFGSPEAS
jgi:hypothetical protein